MRIALLMAAYKRRGLLELALRHNLAAARAAGLDVVPICVVSPDDVGAKEAVEAADWIAVEAENRPLSSKWQAGLTVAREYGVDAVTILGSDDLLSASVFTSLSRGIEDGALVAGYLDVVLFRGVDQKCIKWNGYGEEREGQLIGTGKTYSYEILDALDWALWPHEADRNLDGQAHERCRDEIDGLRARTLAMRLAPSELVLDVKHDPDGVGLGQFDQFPGDEVNTAATLALLGEETAAALVHLTNPAPEFYERELARKLAGEAPKIALVMIASREDSIDLAVRSTMPVIDEIVAVVDERAPARVKAILDLHGGRTERRVWSGFAAARNAAAELAQADWHLVLDDDELFEPGDLLAAIEQAELEGADAVLVTVAATTRPGVVVPSLQPRVFRKGRYRYVYRRHNDVLDDMKMVASTAVVRCNYVGLLPEKVAAMTPELVAMYENPSEPHVPPERERAHAAFHLARAHAVVGKWDEARKWARACREIDEKQPRRRHATAVVIEAQATIFLDGLQAADWFVTDALRQYPDLADLHFIRMQIDAALTMTYGMQASALYPSQPQGCVGLLPRLPHAMALIGIHVAFERGE